MWVSGQGLLFLRTLTKKCLPIRRLQCYHYSKTITLKTRNVANYRVPLLHRMRKHGEKIAIVDQNGSFLYKDILKIAAFIVNQLIINKGILGNYGKSDIHGVACGPRIAFLCPNNVMFSAIVCAIWQIGGIAVPLCKSHPISELSYVVKNSGALAVLSTPEYDSISQKLAKSFDVTHVNIPDVSDVDIHAPTPVVETKEQTALDLNPSDLKDSGAMIVYTSGTTGRPKGVLTTHSAISSQIMSLVKAWEWSSADGILHILPLHHVHGIVNISFCSLWAGATCYMLPKFDPKQVWRCILNNPAINLFMAVPTIYSKLLQYHSEQNYSEAQKTKIEERCQKFRLMVSGSSALPDPILNEWQEITGMRLLEMYGMTEFGMALSNPLHGERLSGHVGSPLPGVKVRIVTRNENNQDLVVVEADEHQTVLNDTVQDHVGELHVKTPSLFKFYWNREAATCESFTSDGWFKTGDTVAYRKDSFKIVGRTSVDIIKSGGYKISALDVEERLLTHPKILECAVVGVPDVDWGQRVAAVIACAKGEEPLSLPELKSWAANRVIPYHVPSLLEIVHHIPRNAMGKVNKKILVEEYFGDKN